MKKETVIVDGKKITVTPSCGNVFKDLNLENADEIIRIKKEEREKESQK